MISWNGMQNTRFMYNKYEDKPRNIDKEKQKLTQLGLFHVFHETFWKDTVSTIFSGCPSSFTAIEAFLVRIHKPPGAIRKPFGICSLM